MKPEAQRIAIAEACGWRMVEGIRAFPSVEWVKARVPEDVFKELLCVDHMEVPDYCNDLNEMHEAEKHLTRAQQFKYADLIRETNPEKIDFSWHCPAAQRAEAFLRTIGKWEEPTP